MKIEFVSVDFESRSLRRGLNGQITPDIGKENNVGKSRNPKR